MIFVVGQLVVNTCKSQFNNTPDALIKWHLHDQICSMY